MPSFDVKIVSGTTCPPWVDAKITHKDFVLHRYLRVQAPTLPALTSVVLHAVVDGVEAPLDGDLGGDLFTPVVVSFSGFPPILSQVGGQTSAITVQFAHNMLGHHEILIRRDSPGAVVLHLDVES